MRTGDAVTNDLTALAGLYRRQAEESPSEFVRWAHKTVREGLDYMEALENVARLSEGFFASSPEYLSEDMEEALATLKEATPWK
jgi:hypothetical protein